MKVIRNRLIPFGDFAAINLFGVLFVKENVNVSRELLNHEMIHTAQQRELLFLAFYVLYCLEWIYRRMSGARNHKEAYLSISFEREAYSHGDDLEYLSVRKPFAMWRK